MRPRTRLYSSALAAMVLVLAACGGGDDAAQPQGGAEGEAGGEPIVVGSSLSLTGAFGPTAAIHQIAGEQFVERLNEEGGLLGRPVEWLVLDDESDQAQVADLYERLISQEQVDLIMSPYATPNILSAVPIAERHGYVLPQHTAVLAPLLSYRCQFPAWSIGPEPNVYVPEQLYDAVASLPEPPQRIAILTNQSGSTDYISYGSPEVDGVGAVSIAEDRGLDVVLEVRYPPGTTNWAPIAGQVLDADPDLVVNNGLGVEPVELIEAMQQLDYSPPLLFSLFPAPGPLLGLGEAGEGVLSVSIFEPNDAVIEQYGPEVRGIVDEFQSRAESAGVPYTAFETQAAASWTAWEILVAAVEGVGEVDHEAMCDHLIENGAETTFAGQLTFDPESNNFWPSNQGLKQIQGGEWVMVWPDDRAAAQLRPPAR